MAFAGSVVGSCIIILVCDMWVQLAGEVGEGMVGGESGPSLFTGHLQHFKTFRHNSCYIGRAFTVGGCRVWPGGVVAVGVGWALAAMWLGWCCAGIVSLCSKLSRQSRN
jgi:hypothetical protein